MYDCIFQNSYRLNFYLWTSVSSTCTNFNKEHRNMAFFLIKIQFSLQHDLADCMYLNVCVQWFVMCCWVCACPLFLQAHSPRVPSVLSLTTSPAWTLTLFVFHTDTSTIDLLIFPVFYSQCWQKSTKRKIRHLLWGLKLSVNRITFCQYFKFLFEHTSMCKNKLVSVKGERLKEVCLSLICLLFGSIHAFS